MSVAPRDRSIGSTAPWATRCVERICRHSFAIGLESSPDLSASRKVAEAIGTVHHEIHFTVQEGLDAIRDVIYFLENKGYRVQVNGHGQVINQMPQPGEKAHKGQTISVILNK